MADSSMKQKVIEAVENLPPDATVEDAMECLYFLTKIQRGLDQADAGNTMPHDEAKKRLLLNRLASFPNQAESIRKSATPDSAK